MPTRPPLGLWLSSIHHIGEFEKSSATKGVPPSPSARTASRAFCSIARCAASALQSQHVVLSGSAEPQSSQKPRTSPPARMFFERDMRSPFSSGAVEEPPAL